MKKKRRIGRWDWRSTKVNQERRLCHEHREYIRGKRGKKALSYNQDDGKRTFYPEKNWKERRTHQYRPGKRGKKHEIYLSEKVCEWYIIDYLKEQDIPYKLEPLVTHYKAMIPKHYWDQYAGHYTIYVPGWRVKRDGYRLIYWTDKQIVLPRIAFTGI